MLVKSTRGGGVRSLLRVYEYNAKRKIYYREEVACELIKVVGKDKNKVEYDSNFIAACWRKKCYMGF